MDLSNYFVNNVIDQVFRGQAALVPGSVYIALISAANGIRANSTVYGAGAVMVALASDGTYHLYKTTAGGTSASSAPTFPGVANETVTDGSVTWVEQNAGLKAGTAIVEPTIGTGSYARVQVLSTLTAWAGTQGAGTTTASTGTSGTTSNNAAVTFPAPTSDWAASPAVVWGIAIYDAATGGNLLGFAPTTGPVPVPNGSPAPSIPNADLTINLS